MLEGKMGNNKILLALFFSCFVLGGCVTEGAVRANSTTEIPNIQYTYAARFEQTSIGMSVTDFKKIWPEAVKSGETLEFVIYEFRESTKYYTDNDYNIGFWLTGTVKSHEFIQRELFYFTDGKLVKYEYSSGASGLNS
jgi:hypothetical protein